MHWAERTAESYEGQVISEECMTMMGSIERAVEVAHTYVSDLKFPTLMEELPCETLDGMVRAADWLINHDEDCHECMPLVVALTWAARGLCFERGEEPAQFDTDDAFTAFRRVGLFAITEKMRRLGIYTSIKVPNHPWDDKQNVICEGEDEEKMREFMKWLGYER